MHHIPHPKDQAEMLTAIAKVRGWQLGKQDALEVVAQLQGFKNWQTLSASLDASLKSKPEPLRPNVPVAPCRNKEGKKLYEANVTADTTMTARLAVWATDQDDAIGKLVEFGGKLWKHGDPAFEHDEGNQDSADVYLGDENDIETLSVLHIDGDDMCASASWADERGAYRIWYTRDEPDHADDSRRNAVTTSIECTPNLQGAKLLEKELAGDDGTSCSEGDLKSDLVRAVKEGNFEDDLRRLLDQATRALRKSATR
jgi:hypothetical protein